MVSMKRTGKKNTTFIAEIRFFIISYTNKIIILWLTASGLFLEASTEREFISTCAETLNYCPVSAERVNWRIACVTTGLGCPKDTFYLCGEDSTGRYIVEGCYPDKLCEPSFTQQFIVDPTTKTAHLECRPCLDGWFEPEETRSSRSSRVLGCSYQHKPAKSSNLVLFENGTKSKPTKWYCDNNNGFCEEDKAMFCDDIPTRTCTCVPGSCPEGYLLQPGCGCIQCATRLDKQNDFKCEPDVRPASDAITQQTTTEKDEKEITKNPEKMNESKERVTPDNDPETVSQENHLWVLVPVIAVLVIIIHIFIAKSRRCSSHSGVASNQGNPDGDNKESDRASDARDEESGEINDEQNNKNTPGVNNGVSFANSNLCQVKTNNYISKTKTYNPVTLIINLFHTTNGTSPNSNNQNPSPPRPHREPPRSSDIVNSDEMQQMQPLKSLDLDEESMDGPQMNDLKTTTSLPNNNDPERTEPKRTYMD